eukprot:1534944-Pyramimonas_sp.AAC.1
MLFVRAHAPLFHNVIAVAHAPYQKAKDIIGWWEHFRELCDMEARDPTHRRECQTRTQRWRGLAVAGPEGTKSAGRQKWQRTP